MAKLLTQNGLRAFGSATLALAVGILLTVWAGDRPAAAASRAIQQGPKLVGSGAVGSAEQGFSVALSADGNTAIVGGFGDNNNAGAAWVFTRSNGVWTPQGPKLVGSNAGGALQGYSVALSGDGNTAIVGGIFDNVNVGAAWVFTRSNGVWTQQGQKLVPLGAASGPNFGTSVALSGDGNTAIAGGRSDNGGAGAAWVFTRSNGVWAPQGAKLVGSNVVGAAQQGESVALSADGNTAVVGGPGDNNATGAAWVFTRSNGAWTPQGQKLVGQGTGPAQQGQSVALSGDGNTAILGGPADNGNAGAAFVFARNNGTWSYQQKMAAMGAGGSAQQGTSVALSGDGTTAVLGGPSDTNNAGGGAAWVFVRGYAFGTVSPFIQQGPKLVGTGAVGSAQQGISVALSADGRTAIVGGYTDNNQAGAAWMFLQNTAATHNLNGDAFSDIAWRQNGGATATWLMNGAQVSQSGGLGTVPINWQIVGQRDFDGDGNCDWLWRDGSTGTVVIWLLNGSQVVQSGSLGAVSTNWSIAGTSDFNADGKGDILWRDNNTGNVAIWLMNGLQVGLTGSLGTVPLSWSIAGTDGKGSILWRDGSTGTVAIWVVSGFQVIQSASLGAVPSNWTIVSTGDFDGNGSTDILWRDTNGNVALWLMNGLQPMSPMSVGNVPTSWTVQATGDFNGDGTSDILWRDGAGNIAIWFMNGAQVTAVSIAAVGTDWVIQGAGAE